MYLVYLPEVHDDITRIFDFLNKKNPLAAQKAMLAIDDGIEDLLENPYIGHPIEKHTDYRQHYVPFGKRPYVLRYRIQEDALIIVRIWHSREDREGE